MNIGIDELTGTEKAVLLVLMAEARPVPNPELAKLGPKLEKPQRERLNERSLIQSVKLDGRIVHELTDDGAAFCRGLIGAEAPEGATGPGKVLYTVLRGLRRYLDRTDTAPADVFIPAPTEPPAPSAAPAASTEQLVNDVYHRLAQRPGSWVGLAKLRAALPDVAHGDLDDTLRQMYRKPGVHLSPEANQKVLDELDWKAAVVIGDQPNHLISIEAP